MRAKRCPTCGRNLDDLPPEFARKFLLTLREVRRLIAKVRGAPDPGPIEIERGASSNVKKRQQPEK